MGVCRVSQSRMVAHTHIYTYIHTHTHTYTYIYIDTHRYTHIHTHNHSLFTHTHTHTLHTHTHTHSSHTHTHTHTEALRIYSFPTSHISAEHPCIVVSSSLSLSLLPPYLSPSLFFFFLPLCRVSVYTLHSALCMKEPCCTPSPHLFI